MFTLNCLFGFFLWKFLRRRRQLDLLVFRRRRRRLDFHIDVVVVDGYDGHVTRRFGLAQVDAPLDALDPGRRWSRDRWTRS